MTRISDLAPDSPRLRPQRDRPQMHPGNPVIPSARLVVGIGYGQRDVLPVDGSAGRSGICEACFGMRVPAFGEETSGGLWRSSVSDGSLIATAIHDGHEVRPDVAELLSLTESERLREEDPCTGARTAAGQTQIVGRRSRFELDLNRPREKAVYRRPADAWGLRVWRSEPGERLISASLAEYDAFYRHVHGILTDAANRHGVFVVFDLHSYNHRRDGAASSPADPARNPEANIGTGSMGAGG